VSFRAPRGMISSRLALLRIVPGLSLSRDATSQTVGTSSGTLLAMFTMPNLISGNRTVFTNIRSCHKSAFAPRERK
jgi:hypothetical protein